ncbi:MAG TPA: hypothetical protein VJ813_20040 [Vicinamibacterales bacterium]|nr:hypothetical protein [Vicinamibacterales bacterium]
MPASADVLGDLTRIANDWRALAAAWHVLLAALLFGLVAGWRPSRWRAGLLLAVPLVSVSALAWASGNPFNGAVFLALAIVFGGMALRLQPGTVRVSSPVRLAPGVLLTACAWVYPHFLQASSWTPYLHSSPLGLLPCPTLLAVLGVSLIVGHLDSRSWGMVLSAAAVTYGLIGTFRLGVAFDVTLLAGAAWAGLAAFIPHRAAATPRYHPSI